MGIGIVGVVVLTRQIGPSDYGRYVGSLAIVTFLTAVTRIGVDTYVIRRPEEPDRHAYRVTFTLMLVNGCAALALGVLLAPQTIGRLIGEEFVGPFQALLVALPLSLLLAPGLASLERDLRYRRVAFVELLNTVVFYGVAVTLAIAQPTVWAPVVGYLAAQAVSLVVTIVASRFPVGLAWSRAEVREIVRFGTPLTLAAACMEGRRLVNPVVVGGLLGPAAVGVVGLALRVAEMLRFVSAAGYRVSVSVLSRLVGDAGRLSRAVSEGMFLQILGVAPLLVGFAVVSGWIVPALLGSSWDETVTVFPPIAAATLLIAFMSLQSSLLYVVGRGTDVLLANLAGLVLLATGAAVAIRVWDSPVAYGIGELASVAGLWFVHRAAEALRVGRLPGHGTVARCVPDAARLPVGRPSLGARTASPSGRPAVASRDPRETAALPAATRTRPERQGTGALSRRRRSARSGGARCAQPVTEVLPQPGAGEVSVHRARGHAPHDTPQLGRARAPHETPLVGVEVVLQEALEDPEVVQPAGRRPVGDAGQGARVVPIGAERLGHEADVVVQQDAEPHLDVRRDLQARREGPEPLEAFAPDEHGGRLADQVVVDAQLDPAAEDQAAARDPVELPERLVQRVVAVVPAAAPRPRPARRGRRPGARTRGRPAGTRRARAPSPRGSVGTARRPRGGT